MPTTNVAILNHLATIRTAVNDAVSDVNYYVASNTDMTANARAASLAKITTVRSALQHASNCSTCAGWDGST